MYLAGKRARRNRLPLVALLCVQYQGITLPVERAIDDVWDGVTRFYHQKADNAVSAGHGWDTSQETFNLVADKSK